MGTNMNNEQAKAILGSYRSNGQDAEDPAFAEALRQSRLDPSLKKWFQEEQEFDAGIARAFQSITPPTEAKSLVQATSAPTTRRGRHWWPLALAASLLIVATIAYSLKSRPTGLVLPAEATLAQLATNLSEHHAAMGLMSTDLSRVRQWIADRGGPLPDTLPPGLANMMILGCETWNTSRGKVSLVCFVGDQKQMVHLYIFENVSEHPGLPAIDHPRLRTEGNWSLALWQNHGHAYVLGSPLDSGLSAESFFQT